MSRRTIGSMCDKYNCNALFTSARVISLLMKLKVFPERYNIPSGDIFLALMPDYIEKVTRIMDDWNEDFPGDYESICKSLENNKQDELYIRFYEKSALGGLLADNIDMLYQILNSVLMFKITDKLYLLTYEELQTLKTLTKFKFDYKVGTFARTHFLDKIKNINEDFEILHRYCDVWLKLHFAVSTIKRRFAHTYWNPRTARGQRHINKMFEECCV